jgi:uncharacterized membrane protein YkvA (DUF1232 family)
MPSTIPGIPHESQALFDRLHDAPLVPVAELRAELKEYAARLATTTAANKLLDATLAESITQCCEGLLDMLEQEADEATRRLVQAAVRYFVVEEDVEPDRDSLWGLDDDAVVCGAVAYHLGRDDLADGL